MTYCRWILFLFFRRAFIYLLSPHSASETPALSTRQGKARIKDLALSIRVGTEGKDSGRISILVSHFHRDIKIQMVAKATTLYVWLRCYESPLMSSLSSRFKLPQWYVGPSHQACTYITALTSKLTPAATEHPQMMIFVLKICFRNSAIEWSNS